MKLLGEELLPCYQIGFRFDDPKLGVDLTKSSLDHFTFVRSIHQLSRPFQLSADLLTEH